jgi:hypothetical protein
VSFRGASLLRASPESITKTRTMDSGLRVKNAHPGMTAVTKIMR